MELNADVLLINDRKAREIATKLGIITKWTTEVLTDAVSEKFISSFNEFEQILNAMIENGLWIERDFYTKLLNNIKKKF